MRYLQGPEHRARKSPQEYMYNPTTIEVYDMGTEFNTKKN